MTLRPLIARPAQDVFASVIANSAYRTITVAQFCADVEFVATRLPQTRHVVNLCHARYAFMVVFFAAIRRGQINLLPGKRDGETARQLANEYEQSSVVSDQSTAEADMVLELDPGTHGEAISPLADPASTVALVFTSGSTGQPQAHRKTWAMFSDWREVHWRQVPSPPAEPALLVSTVPPWHMYGLEWTMLVPAIAPLVVHCGPDFYPRDVVAALDHYAGPSILISTPLHLRALAKVPAPRQPVHTVVSATAPLEASLVREVEDHLHSRVLEIYGCSEVGSLAWRLPGREENWQFFDCFDLEFEDGTITIAHPELPAPVALTDVFEPVGSDLYRLLGRSTDIVKVGGKRDSLARLNGLLAGIEGVVDGFFYQPEDHGLPATGRLGAVVVAPTMSDRQLRQALSSHVDPVFLPRPLHHAQALPRDATSKMQRAAMTDLLRRLHGSVA